MVAISVYALLGILELVLLLAVLTGVALYLWRKARRELAAARRSPGEPGTPVKAEPAPGAPQRGYADFLAEQLELSSRQLDAGPAPADADGAARSERQLLAARHQFLQLELDVHKLTDPAARRSRASAGMQALLDGLNPPPDAAPAEGAARARSEEHKLRDQIEHLRTVIGNQHGVMRELRDLLEAHETDSAELQEALRKLDDAEAEGKELHRCLEAMEQENTRLRHAPASAAPGIGPDAEMLRDLVGSQQRTISKLQGMLQTLSADPDKSRELEEAIGKIQRANSELNSCVMVLEDENSMLRDRIETLEGRLAGIGAESDRSDTEAFLDDLFSGGAGKAG
jgi:DNA repair exonuclease SbcCD ATPase subunit